MKTYCRLYRAGANRGHGLYVCMNKGKCLHMYICIYLTQGRAVCTVKRHVVCTSISLNHTYAHLRNDLKCAVSMQHFIIEARCVSKK